MTLPWQATLVEIGAEAAGSSQRHPARAGNALQADALRRWFCSDAAGTPNGLEMSRPASQGWYRAKRSLRLAGSAPSSC